MWPETTEPHHNTDLRAAPVTPPQDKNRNKRLGKKKKKKVTYFDLIFLHLTKNAG